MSPAVKHFLFLQVLFTLTFWLLVRQSVKENFSKKRKTVTTLQAVRTGGQLHAQVQDAVATAKPEMSKQRL